MKKFLFAFAVLCMAISCQKSDSHSEQLINTEFENKSVSSFEHFDYIAAKENSPLKFLSEEALKAFKEKLVFHEGHLRGAYTYDVEKLPLDQQKSLWAALLNTSIDIDEDGTVVDLWRCRLMCPNRYYTLCSLNNASCATCCGQFFPHFMCISPCPSPDDMVE